MDVHTPALSLSVALFLISDDKNLFNISPIKLHNHAEIVSKNGSNTFFGTLKFKQRENKRENASCFL